METGDTGSRGSIGRDTYDRVRALVDQGMKRQEAFQRVAEDTNRTAATVQTAFYRVARSMPISAAVTRRFAIDRPSSFATIVRTAKWPCVDTQTWCCPSAARVRSPLASATLRRARHSFHNISSQQLSRLAPECASAVGWRYRICGAWRGPPVFCPTREWVYD